MTLPRISLNQNKLLSALPIDEYGLLQPDLESVKMRRGEIVYKSGEPIKYVYFPESCIVSMITVFGDGSSVESGIVGCEGMTAAGLALSNSFSVRETFVQTSGQSLRIKTDKFCRLFEETSTLKQFVTNYASAFFEQVAQAGACSNHHSLSERLARLLLMCHDRIEGNKIFITHEFIAQMLGAYRPNVTNIAMQLKEQKLIDYQRGLIEILDQKGLEKVACECYETINDTYRHYLSSLEIRSLNARAERASLALNEEMKRRQRLSNEVQTNIHNLHAAVAGIKSLHGEYSLCTNCYYICDEHGRWRQMEFFIQKRLNLTINRSLCPNCCKNK